MGLAKLETPLTQGIKFDEGKLRYDLLPTKSVAQVVEVLTYGAEKYEPRNWEKGMSHSRLYSAAQRHLNAYWGGQDLDEETAFEHLAHAATNLLMLLQLRVTHPDLDDRPV